MRLLVNYIEGKIYSNMNRFGSTLRTALYNEQAVNKLISLKTVNKRYTNYIDDKFIQYSA